jgi:hypothetical protein
VITKRVSGVLRELKALNAHALLTGVAVAESAEVETVDGARVAVAANAAQEAVEKKAAAERDRNKQSTNLQG